MNSDLLIPTLTDPHKARTRISGYIRLTPVQPLELQGRMMFLKLENRQRTGSFKLRGALNAVLASPEFTSSGFITASAGNHGLGAAAAARLFGGVATVVVYQGASREKVRKISRMGGKILELGRDYDEAEELAMKLARDKGLPFLHPFDDPLVIAGQGTVALELLEQVPQIRALFVPVGGGGLLAGCALTVKNLKPSTKVIGVQPAESAAMVRSLADGTVVETPIGNTICDALAGRFVSWRTLEIAKRYVDDVVAVREESIIEAMRIVYRELGLVIEPSAAVGPAALMERGGLVEDAAAILSGGNISKSHFLKLISE